ncbi:YceI family protein [Caulobacter segnis]|uniref:YceI family protein n=1 Tax=Caulobacter segnis TaxID=88688 RepID=UPI001CC0BB95|nr:YceI family protein [Caulobacter segnis]UAL09505.1 YceI family protein [Caulobacter segnis]
MKSFLAVTAFALLALSPLAASAAPDTDPAKMPAGRYEVDKTHASITGRVLHQGYSFFTFRFARFDAAFDYDPAAPDKSALKVSIDTTSFDSGYDKADAEFPKEFLGADKFPAATFVSNGLIRQGDKGVLSGDLTLNGVTKPIKLDVVFHGSGASGGGTRAGFSATGVIKRSEFGSTRLLPMIGDDVALTIEIEFKKAG